MRALARALAAALVALLALAGCSTGSDQAVYGGSFTFVSPGGKTEISYPPSKRGTIGTLEGPDLMTDKTISAQQFKGKVVVIEKERERGQGGSGRDRPREVLERVAAIATRLGKAVRVLGAFSVLAGLVILAGSISAASARRAREAALLKVLGVTRGGVATALAVEYALVGLVAGLVGTLGATALAGSVLTAAFEVSFRPSPLLLAAAPFAIALLAAAAGLAVSLRALQVRPLEVLRGE